MLTWILYLQVKGLLRERKVDELIDPELEQNYDHKEVEQLLQVSLAFYTYLELERGKGMLGQYHGMHQQDTSFVLLPHMYLGRSKREPNHTKMVTLY